MTISSSSPFSPSAFSRNVVARLSLSLSSGHRFRSRVVLARRIRRRSSSEMNTRSNDCCRRPITNSDPFVSPRVALKLGRFLSERWPVYTIRLARPRCIIFVGSCHFETPCDAKLPLFVAVSRAFHSLPARLPRLDSLLRPSFANAHYIAALSAARVSFFHR